MKNQFDLKLDEFNKNIIELGALCEDAINTVAKAIFTHTTDVEISDEEIVKKERQIEDMCIRLLLQYQPVARDLRFISATLKMITDMKRIGIQAQDIADTLRTIQLDNLKNDYGKILEMAETCKTMVRDSVDAFVKRDIETAKQVIDLDDIVDEYFAETKKELIEKLTIGEDVLDLLLIAKYFEKIGDHSSNIAKWVIFSITGEHVEG